MFNMKITVLQNQQSISLKNSMTGKYFPKIYTDYLMKVLWSTSTGLNKMVEQLPKNTPVARKTGASGKNKAGLTGAENEIGIITLLNGKHYALAVFVSNSTETDAVNCRMISDISRRFGNILISKILSLFLKRFNMKKNNNNNGSVCFHILLRSEESELFRDQLRKCMLWPCL